MSSVTPNITDISTHQVTVNFPKLTTVPQKLGDTYYYLINMRTVVQESTKITKKTVKHTDASDPVVVVVDGLLPNTKYAFSVLPGYTNVHAYYNDVIRGSTSNEAFVTTLLTSM